MVLILFLYLIIIIIIKYILKYYNIRDIAKILMKI